MRPTDLVLMRLCIACIWNRFPPKYDHISSTLESLNWLPMKEHLLYKIQY